jgi:hypothetical protein
MLYLNILEVSLLVLLLLIPSPDDSLIFVTYVLSYVGTPYLKLPRLLLSLEGLYLFG